MASVGLNVFKPDVLHISQADYDRLGGSTAFVANFIVGRLQACGGSEHPGQLAQAFKDKYTVTPKQYLCLSRKRNYLDHLSTHGCDKYWTHTPEMVHLHSGDTSDDDHDHQASEPEDLHISQADFDRIGGERAVVANFVVGHLRFQGGSDHPGQLAQAFKNRYGKTPRNYLGLGGKQNYLNHLTWYDCDEYWTHSSEVVQLHSTHLVAPNHRRQSVTSHACSVRPRKVYAPIDGLDRFRWAIATTRYWSEEDYDPCEDGYDFDW